MLRKPKRPTFQDCIDARETKPKSYQSRQNAGPVNDPVRQFRFQNTPVPVAWRPSQPPQKNITAPVTETNSYGARDSMTTFSGANVQHNKNMTGKNRASRFTNANKSGDAKLITIRSLTNQSWLGNGSNIQELISV